MCHVFFVFWLYVFTRTLLCCCFSDADRSEKGRRDIDKFLAQCLGEKSTLRVVHHIAHCFANTQSERQNLLDRPMI